MNRSNASTIAHPARRSLVLHHHPLLNDPEVVAFLNNAPAPVYDTLEEKLIQANEPELLLELIGVTQRESVTLRALDETGDTVALPDGLFEHLLQHIDHVPCINSLTVAKVVLSQPCCKLLQTVLANADCTLTDLTFSNCSFADAQVQFPLHAATIQAFNWIEPEMHGATSPMEQVLPALTAWARLRHVRLVKQEDPLNFAVITQTLVHNPNVSRLHLVCDTVPAKPGDPAYQPQQDPALLLNLLMHDQLPLTHLTLRILDTHNEAFNQYFLQGLTQCLMTNTTLELVEVPGLKMSTQAGLNPFNAIVNTQYSLLSLVPLEGLGNETPPVVRKNQRQRYWFTQEFVLGAAQAFLRLVAVPPDLGVHVAPHLAPTPAERAYSGPLMALICKATHQSAVKLRSAGLREAALIYIRTNDRPRCLELLGALVQHPQLDLVPPDKRHVVEYAISRNRLNFLPPGYAH